MWITGPAVSSAGCSGSSVSAGASVRRPRRLLRPRRRSSRLRQWHRLSPSRSRSSSCGCVHRASHGACASWARPARHLCGFLDDLRDRLVFAASSSYSSSSASSSTSVASPSTASASSVFFLDDARFALVGFSASASAVSGSSAGSTGVEQLRPGCALGDRGHANLDLLPDELGCVADDHVDVLDLAGAGVRVVLVDLAEL